MASTMDSINDTASDAKEQIRALRDQVDSLMRERISPVISDAAGRAQDAARQAQDFAGDQAEALSGRVREMPLTAIGVSLVVGYLLGRVVR